MPSLPSFSADAEYWGGLGVLNRGGRRNILDIGGDRIDSTRPKREGRGAVMVT